jgi:hypothetical protein
MKKLLVIILFFTTSAINAQKLHFKVVNAESLEGLAEAKVTSALQKKYITYTNATGGIHLNYLPGDTITISKNDFHSIHLYIPHANIDTVHVITVSMVPGQENNTPNVKQFSNLSMFEYYFVHKTEEKNNLKVQVFENKNAAQQRQNSSFKIASVDLNDFHKQQKK